MNREASRSQSIPPVPTVGSGSAASGPQGADRKLLIVEDEQGLLEILELNLRSAGYSVCTAADGITAWRLFEREQPDLLLLDLNLPQMSGFRLLELVRSESDLPVLIITAYDFAEAEEVARYRPKGFIKKPFNIDELIALVDTLVTSQRRPEPGDASQGSQPG